jgi:plastocyanin
MSVTEQHQLHHLEPTLDPATARWLPVQQAVAVVLIVTLAAFQMIVAGTVIPPIVVVMVLFLLAGLATLKRPRGGSIAIGVLSLLTLLAFIPDIVRDLRDPDSAFTFVLTGLATVTVVVGAIGGAFVLTRRTAPSARRGLSAAAVLAALALVATATVARLTLDSPAAQPGDLLVVAVDVWFVPDTIDAAPGLVSVHLENRDLMPHDFAIDELGVALHVSERASARVEFEAPAGTYTAICTLPGHGRMAVTLNVG